MGRDHSEMRKGEPCGYGGVFCAGLSLSSNDVVGLAVVIARHPSATTIGKL